MASEWRCGGQESGASLLNDGQTGNLLKVAHMGGDHTEAKLQCGRGDEEVFKGYVDAFGGLAAFDTTCETHNVEGEGMHGDIVDQLVDKGLPPLTAFLGSGTLDTVNEFHDCDDRQANLNLSVVRLELLQDPPDCVALTLGGDHDSCVED